MALLHMQIASLQIHNKLSRLIDNGIFSEERNFYHHVRSDFSSYSELTVRVEKAVM